MDSKNILITGGGTGGHLSIAKVLATELKKRDYNLIFVGSTIGQDKEWFLDSDIFEKTYFLKSKGFVNKNIFQKIIYPFFFIQLIYQAIKIIKYYKIDKIISVGGFSAAPASFASILMRKKLFIHEQNCAIGLLNKILKPFSMIFFSSYDADSPVSDYPIDNKFFQIYRKRDSVKTILFLGGSQGARAINKFAMDMAKYLNDNGIKIIHQCGKLDFECVKQFYEENNINAECFPFAKEIEKYMYLADIAISRSGAGSLWELSAAGIPTLFVPYPYAASDHQYKNALFLQSKNLCFLCRESDLKKENLDTLLKSDVESISLALKMAILPDGCARIIDNILIA